MSNAPSITAAAVESETVTEFPPPLSGQGASRVGTQSSSPGMWVPPAEAVGAESASTLTRANGASSLFIGLDSPVIEVVDLSGFASAKTVHSNTPADSDLVLFRALAARNDFDSLTALCRERLLTADDPPTYFRWIKDRAIVEELQGRHAQAYDLLASAHWLARQVTGTPRVKYENEFGLVLVEFNRTALGLDRFGLALENAKTDTERAGVEHNIGRAYAAQGEHAKAAPYFERALVFALESKDRQLEGEVRESLKEFGGIRRPAD